MRSHVKASPVGSTLGRGGRRLAFARAFPFALTLAAFALLALAPLSQARVVVDGFGTSGTEGGQFGTPRGTAVNNSGVGSPEGTIYVVDSQNRVQRFSPGGAFQRLWGFDVVEGGGTGFEICTIASECQAGAEFPTTANGGQLGNPQGIALDQTDGHVYVTEEGNRRVSEFDADGNFVRAWGRDVVEGGGTGFEICTVASECKQGETGGLGGEFGASLGYPAVDSSGSVFVADTSNNRIQQFDTSGNFVRLAGGDVVTNGATGTGTLETTSKTVTNLVTTSKYFEVGQIVTSSGGSLPPGTTVTAVDPTTLTLSEFPTANGSETITAAAGAENIPSNEIQTVSIGNVKSGNAFNLGFDGNGTGTGGTADIGIGTNVLTNVKVTSGEFVVGQYIAGSKIAPGTKITAIDPVAHTITLSKPNPDDKGAGGMAIGSFAIPGDAPGPVVQSALESLPSVGPGDVSVSGPAGGPWEVTFEGPRYGGADVPQISIFPMLTGIVGGVSPGVTSANGPEVCAIAANCRGGASGTSLGQFSNTSATRVAVDASGNVFVTDKLRLQKFSPSLTLPAAFGAGALANFTTTSPENLAPVAGGSRIAVSVRGNVVNGSASEAREIVELDATDGSLEDASLVGAGLTGIGGLAERDATSTLYATTGSEASPRRVLALDAPIAPPVPAMSPVTTKGTTTATFAGTIDPAGGIGVSCKFEYSTDQANWTVVPEPACPTLVTGGGAQSVTENVTDLTPNSKYFVRLSVTRLLDSASTKVSVAQSFSTDHVAPIATNLGATQITDTSMRLVGEINPMHSITGYVFEYGPTPALGSSTPAVDIGDGVEPQVVSRAIQGLSPGTTYYFRLVATNLAGSNTTTSDSARTRITPLPLSDDRNYEMVSPAEKNGGGALSGRGGATVALDGQAVQFDTSSLFGEPPGVQPFTTASYVSRRTSEGWRTRATNPAGCRTDLDDEVGVPFLLLESMFSPNLDKFVFGNVESAACPTPPLDPSAPLPSANLYLTDLTAEPASYTLIAPKPSPALQTYATDSGILAGFSDDFSHIVYESGAQQTPDAPPPQLTGQGNDRAVPSVFEWDDNAKELRLVSKDSSGNAITTGAISVSAGTISNLPAPLNSLGDFLPPPNAGVSDDGSRIFFTSPAEEFGGCTGECHLYMRENATTTHRISESECTISCGPTLPTLLRASSTDGSKILMLTSGKLTNDDTSDTDAGADLFIYTHSSNPTTDSNLTLVSQDLEPADGVGNGAGAPVLQGIVATSNDLETIYFLSSEQLVSGEPTGPGSKLYRWRWNNGSPVTENLATLPSIASGENGSQRNPNRFRTTPSGENLLLETTGQLSPAADRDSTIDLYRWDPANGWLCASCQEPGVPSQGDVVVPERGGLKGSITDDGDRVFFSISESLVSDDLNEGKRDVYEWHDGAVSLISSGTGQEDVAFLGASASGEDVYFYTEERLVGWDIDQAGDIYDARIGGGLPEPPPTGAPCEGEACRGATSVAAPAASAATAAFEGPGDTRTATRCRKGTRKVTVRGRSVCKKPHKRRSGKRRAQRRSQAGANRGASR